MHAVYDTGLRRTAVSESRALKRQRETLEDKRDKLQAALAEVNANLEVVQDKKRRTRSQTLATFEPSKDETFSIPMTAEEVEARKISADAKRGLMEQAMAVAEARELQRVAAENARMERSSCEPVSAACSSTCEVVQPASWLGCLDRINWSTGGGEPFEDGTPAAAARPLLLQKRVSTRVLGKVPGKARRKTSKRASIG